MNSISFFKALLMKELEEKDLPGNQEKIAQAAEPKDKITAADFAALRAKKGMKKEMDHSDAADKKIDASEKAFLQKIYKDVPVEKVPEKHRWALEMKEGEDHEVSMASNSLESIIKSAIELKAKMGDQEKDIPAWIQDHITNAENYINQASKNYHEYHDSEHDMDELPDGTIEEPATMQERREYDQKAMEKLGFNFYPGGRSEAWEFATQELGISPDEILGKMSDDDVYNAIDSSLNILGYYNDEDEDLNETSLSSMLDNLLEAKKKPSAGLTKKQKSAISKKAKAGKDIGKKGKGFEKIAKAAAEKYGSKERGEKVAAAAMWKSAAKKAK